MTADNTEADTGLDLPPAFFTPVDDCAYLPTRATQGPWDPGAMHGGPVAALLATLLEREVAMLSPTLRLARLSCDFLGALPVAELQASVTTPRPGRRVALLEATLADGGRTLAVGRGWFIDAAAAGDDHPVNHGRSPSFPGELEPLAPAPPLPGPQPQVFFPGLDHFGYGDACEWRFTSGGFDQAGPAGVWCRPRIPLMDGEPLTGMQRMLILADAANGISCELAFGTWMFIPPGITATILREPVGEWVHLAARTTLGADGIGLCHGHVADEHGGVGTVSQPLLISRV
jgi:hypothetical protein